MTTNNIDKIERAIEMLDDLLQRKIHSPAAYVLEASPHVTVDDEAVLGEVKALQNLANRHAEEAAQRIMALEGVPHGGSYAVDIADSNYLGVRHLLGRLLGRLEGDIARFEAYRDECEVLEAKDLFSTVVQDDRALLERIRKFLHELEAKRPLVDTHHP